MMTSKQKIAKAFSFPYFTNRFKVNGNENDMEIIKQFDNVQMIPYDSLALSVACEPGTLCVIKYKNVDRNHLSFYTALNKQPEWDIILDQHAQIKKPRPNILSVLSYGTTTLFKFSDATEADQFYACIENVQGNFKVVIKSDFPTCVDFQPMSLSSMNVARSNNTRTQLKERCVERNVAAKQCDSKKSKPNSKPKLITNSFRTIVNAAKTAKQKKQKNVDLPMDLQENDDDQSPLLL